MKHYAQPFKRLKAALGTFLEISVDGAIKPPETVIRTGFDEAKRLEKTLSFFDPESALSHLNRAPSELAIKVDFELLEVLKIGEQIETYFSSSFRLMPQCRHLNSKDRCYEIKDDFVTRRNGCVFDLSGIAKGYIVDRVFEKLEDLCHPDADILVNAGGDLRFSGSRNIEIRVPSQNAEKRFLLELSRSAVATSAIKGNLYKTGTRLARYPQTKIAEERNLASVTVVAQRCLIADAFTKVSLFGKIDPERSNQLGIKEIFYFNEDGARTEP